MLISLEKVKYHPSHAGKVVHWEITKPFVANKRGALIHRPRSVTIYNIHRVPHLGMHFYCGMGTTGQSDKFTLLDSVPLDRVLCERCELAAVHSGLPSADLINGHHVHIGGVKAVRTCCEEGE